MLIAEELEPAWMCPWKWCRLEELESVLETRNGTW